MKGLYLVLLLAGNLFSQTTTEAVISDSTQTTTEAVISDSTFFTDVTGSGIIFLDVMDFQDCKGDDLMFNYVSGQIQEINLADFGDKQASFYLIQAPEVLEAYQWMRKNRGNKYTMHEMVVRVNKWYQGLFARLSKTLSTGHNRWHPECGFPHSWDNEIEYIIDKQQFRIHHG